MFVTLEAIEGSDDLLLPIPSEMMSRLCLQVGDELSMDVQDGVLFLQRLPTHLETTGTLSLPSRKSG